MVKQGHSQILRHGKPEQDLKIPKWFEMTKIYQSLIAVSESCNYFRLLLPFYLFI